MKRIARYLTIPCRFADNKDLSVEAKWLAIIIDSYADIHNGTTMSIRALSTLVNMPQNLVKESLKELYDKGCADITIDSNGTQIIKVDLYKARYGETSERKTIEEKADEPPLPYDDISNKCSAFCMSLPKITRWTPQRKQKLRSAMKQAGINLNELYIVFRLIDSSSFLNGSSGSGWQCSFDWLIRSSTNIIKVLEGNYHRSHGEQRAYELIMGHANNNEKEKTSEYRQIDY